MIKSDNKNLESVWRADFPSLLGDDAFVFLDSAASSQKPLAVIEVVSKIFSEAYANIHRGLYKASQELSQSYEDVREKVADFINAPSHKNIVFTRNATESVNMVAQSWGRVHLKQGDEILISAMEHHANIVPWYVLAEQIGIKVKVAPLLDDGRIDFEAFEKLLSDRIKLVAVSQISNVLGVVNPINDLIKMVRRLNGIDTKVLVDGAQGVVHQKTDVSKLDADFYVFTGHKLYAPTGVGVLYGKADALESMIPYQTGGDMVEVVSHNKGISYREPPYRFEAGTPAIAEVIGLGSAIDYLQNIGMPVIENHEKLLSEYVLEVLQEVKGLHLYGTQDLSRKAGIFSFNIEGVHSSDVAMILDQCDVAVRSGHHCAMPLMQSMGIDSTVRASFGLYTNKNDIDALCAALHKVREFF